MSVANACMWDTLVINVLDIFPNKMLQSVLIHSKQGVHIPGKS